MEENRKLELARRIVERTDCSLFLTGRAGTGKTTFLRRLRESSRKRMVVTAPTGIAAINAGGVTLHSFFQLDFGPFIPGTSKPSGGRYDRFSRDKLRIIRTMDVLVIDEISMVRADLLDAVDSVLRRHRDRSRPFGGVQLLLIGDLQQLPPVVMDSERELLRAHYDSPYFFDSHALKDVNYATIELDHVYRQDEGEFLHLLNAIRDNRADSSVLSRLNRRHIPGFNPDDREGYIRLTTHNRLANSINDQRLEALPGKAYTYEAAIQGNFPESSWPVARSLTLKKGAQVMFVKNDTGAERLFYNGMIGHVTDLGENFVKVFPINGCEEIDVPLVTWENMKYVIDEDKKEIKEEREGAFSQLPLKPAWAITIHKSQGLTFDRAIIDAASSFAHGQTYVALSRCRTMEGLVLERPLSPAAIISDRTVQDFMEREAESALTEQGVSNLENAYAMHLAGDLFDFQMMQNALDGLTRIIKENFFRAYPALVSEADLTATESRKEITEVGQKFCRQLRAMDAANPGTISPEMQTRIKEGANYFLNKLEELREKTAGYPEEHDNRNVTKKLSERTAMFADALRMKLRLMKAFSEKEFSITTYLDSKADATLSETLKATTRKPRTATSQYSSDNVHPGLFDRLSQWRREKASDLGVPAYTIASTQALLAISNHLPTTIGHLMLMPGIGRATADRFGEEFLSMVDRFITDNPNLTVLPMPEKKKKRRH